MKLSRRDFLKSAGISAVGVSALAVLAGCSSSDDDTSSSSSSTSSSSTSSSETTTESTTSDISKDLTVTTGGKQETQVDKLKIVMTSTSVDISPFSPVTPSAIAKSLVYAQPFFQPYYAAPIEDAIPWLAKSYTQIDDYNYEIELFDYITDDEGNSITADDIIWSLDQSSSIGQFVDAGSNIESMEKVDDYTVHFTLTTNAPNTFIMLMSNTQFCVCSQAWYEGAADDVKSSNPVGPGPYKAVSFTSGSACVLEANDDYWQTDEELNSQVLYACRNVKTLDYTVITESSMRVIALQNGEVDVSSISASDLGEFVDLDTGDSLDGWVSLVPQPTSIHGLFPNMDETTILGGSLELRQAVFYAIDPEQIMLASGNNDYTAIMLGAFASPIYDGYLDEWDEREYFPYDPEKAIELREQAGYGEGEITLRLLTSSALYGDSVRSVIISALNAVGFEVENIAVDQALFSTYKNDNTIWDLMMDLKGCTTGHITSTFNYNFAAENYSDGQGGVNFCKDETLYELLDAVMADSSEENVRAFEAYCTDNAIIYGLYASSNPLIAHDGITEIASVGATAIYPAFKFADDYVSKG